MLWDSTRLALRAARRTWRPKRLPDRGQNPKKSMLKKASFSVSIFQGFQPPFGRVFGRIFWPKMDAKSDLKKSLRQAKSIGKTNTKSMSAFLRQNIFRAKIDEILHVFWNLDFERILGTFWEGFGKPKSSIFAFDVFSMSFFKRASEGENIVQIEPTRHRKRKFGAGLRWSPGSWGETKRGV